MKNNDRLYYTLLITGIYAVAMAFVESAVVVYLREIYYPNGFDFPLSSIEPDIGITELFRELATLIMLLSVSFLASKKSAERLAYFIYCFAIWDIFYYIFLYLILGWPESLLTWDILFLIPVSWVGPVITPVIISITMIALALIIVIRSGQTENFKIQKVSVILFITGSIIVILSFIWDYSSYLLKQFTLKEIMQYSKNIAVLEFAQQYIPEKFNWFLFIVGELVIIAGIVAIIQKRNGNEQTLHQK